MKTSLLWVRYVAVFAMMIGIWVIQTPEVHACKCAPQPIQNYVGKASHVFVGKLINYQKGQRVDTFTYAITKSLKGKVGASVVLKSPGHSCGLTTAGMNAVGNDYLIFANRGAKGLWGSQCMGSGNLKYAHNKKRYALLRRVLSVPTAAQLAKRAAMLDLKAAKLAKKEAELKRWEHILKEKAAALKKLEIALKKKAKAIKAYNKKK